MKKTFIALSASMLILSCSTQKEEISSQQKTGKIVGNDQDKNGCKGSAGYQWSQLKNTCIRPFEEGIRLNSVNNSGSSAYLIPYGDDIEIFSVEAAPSIVLQKQNETTWKNGNWTVEVKNSIYNFKKDGNTLYSNSITKK